jgi:subtilase family serine protease
VIAPGARIRIVLGEGASRNDAIVATERAFAKAVNENLGDVIVLTTGTPEPCSSSGEAAAGALHSMLRLAQSRGITVVASSGDTGAAVESCRSRPPSATKGVELPAADPLVTAVGGTLLLADPRSGRYVAERGWSHSSRSLGTGEQVQARASGGGFSRIYARPSYQDGVPGIGAQRGIPDVSADADAETGLALLVHGEGRSRLLTGGGTSASAPVWGGLAALADDYAGRRLGFLNPGLYRIGRSPLYKRAFHDITRGNNSLEHVTGYRAARGWDAVTGWGSPDAEALIPLLASSAPIAASSSR